MLFLSLILLAAAVLLLAWAIRGRVIARGRFCRHCKFDLIGLDASRPGAPCPECGRTIAEQRRPRTVLRRPRRVAASVALVLMLFASGLLAMQVPALAARVVPHANDRQLLWLDRLGLQPARAEVAARLSDVLIAHPAFAPLIDTALDDLLNQQTTTPDRYAEIIQAAWIGAQFTDAQLQRLFQGRIELDCSIRDTAPPGSSTVPVSVNARLRFADIQPWLVAGQAKPGMKILLIADRGGPMADTELFAASRLISHELSGLTGGEIGFPGMSSTLPPIPDTTANQPSHRMHAGIRVVTENQRTGARLVLQELIREQSVRLAPNPDLLVPAERIDVDEIARFARSVSMRAIDPASQDRWTDSFAQFSFVIYCDATPPFDVAYRIQAALPGRLPEDFGQTLFISSARQLKNSSVGFAFFANVSNDATSPQGSTRVSAWRSATEADIHLIPDPQAAYLRPPIGPILPTPLVIRNVPITRRDDTPGNSTLNQHPSIPAELLTPEH